jgi:hypothetical protein
MSLSQQEKKKKEKFQQTLLLHKDNSLHTSCILRSPCLYELKYEAFLAGL